MPITPLFSDILERTSGNVSLIDKANQNTLRSRNADELIGFANSNGDVWLDLVTDCGEAIGLRVLGNPDVVTPRPSVVMPEGMIYLIDGDPLPDQATGTHLCPLSTLLSEEGNANLDGLTRYSPADLYLKTPGSRREITLMTGRRRDEPQGKWKEIASSFGQFEDLLQQHKEGKKDGHCFLQGRSVNGARKALAMIENHILGVDLDSGAPLWNVIEAITKHGLHAVIYTTHSHLKDTSVIKRDHFMKWVGSDEVEIDAVRDYLINEKGTLPEVVEKLTVLDEARHTEEGVVILVQHKPMPKFRAVFPLAEPFVFAKRGGSQKDAIAEWKERYAGFCTELGLFFDEKCVDPARLFYLPRHPVSSTEHGSWLIVGDTLKIEAFARVKVKRRTDRNRSTDAANAFTAAACGVDGNDDADGPERFITSNGFNLKAWASSYAKRFEIQALYEDVIGDDYIRDDRGNNPGVHVECPFEAEHSSLGGNGTFVVNASDNLDEGRETGFTFHCTHNACAGRDRLDYIKELVEQDFITVEDLKSDNYLLEVEGDVDAEVSESAAKPKHMKVETPPPGSLEEAFETLNKTFAIVNLKGKVRIIQEDEDNIHDFDIMSESDFKLWQRSNKIYVSDSQNKMKEVSVAEEWLKSSSARKYLRMEFIPGKITPPHIYNLFKGYAYTPEHREGAYSLFEEHLFENLCDSDETLYDYVFSLFAQLFQNPAEKPGVALVVTGRKGTGKTAMFDHILHLLGEHGLKVAKPGAITGNFNAILENKLLVVADEAIKPGDPNAEAVWKDMITSDTMLLEPKGRDQYKAKNFVRLGVISNDDHVVNASLGDERRYCVLRCGDGRMNDTKFFDGMKEQMRNGGYEALLYDFLNHVPAAGWQSLRKPPSTRHLQAQQLFSSGPLDQFMKCLLTDGIYEFDVRSDLRTIALSEESATEVPLVELRDAVEHFIAKTPDSGPLAKFDPIAAAAVRWFNAEEVKRRKERGTYNSRSLRFPALPEARKHVHLKFGLEIGVPDHIEEEARGASSAVVPLRKGARR